jgi:thiol-disulfide isomerase/thioredoxin
MLAVSLLLSAIFAVAAVAKLRDRAGAREMLGEFGVPQRGVAVLIGAELAIAVTLAVPVTHRVGALAALAALAVFSAAIAVQLAHGRHPTCRCFGTLRPSRVGASTLARNALLAALAACVAAGGAAIAGFLAVAATAAICWAILEGRRLRALRPGSRAPHVAPVADALAAGRPVVLVFSSPSCVACQALAPELARWRAERTDLTVKTVEDDDEVLAAFRIAATPSALLIAADGVIASSTAVGAEAIIDLVEGSTAAGGLARRGLVARGALGIAALSVLPLGASAAHAARTVARAARTKSLKVDGAWLCNQTYALCTAAQCVPDPKNAGFSICTCRVTRGWSVGFKTCSQRAAKGNTLHSNFSMQRTAHRKTMKCTAPGLWVQCLDVVCSVDPDNPSLAKCGCVNNDSGDFYTFGGGCDASTCSSVIWSATSAPFPGGAQYEKGLKRLGVPFKVPPNCPT